MIYEPNFNDPRTRKRSLRAIGFVCAVMSTTKSQEWSSRYIDQYLGNQRNDLSKYLRENLLICTDDYYRYNTNERGICKKYLLNQEGLDLLRENLKLNNIQLYPSVVEVARTDHLTELNSGKFEYNDKSNRLWHPLQRYRKSYRTQVLIDHGYQHHYDISTCAPQLIHQYSQQIPELLQPHGKRQKLKWSQGPMDLWLFALRRYLTEKEAVRLEIASALDLPIAAVKEVINALFAGAVISRNPDTDIYHILAGDQSRIVWLQQDPYVQQLVCDIRICWEYIRPVMQKRTKKTANGTDKLLAITSKQKWHLYFELERRVIDSVRLYLSERSIKHFLIHDGWACDQEIDEIELRNHVRDQTGFDLTFDYEKNETEQYTTIP